MIKFRALRWGFILAGAGNVLEIMLLFAGVVIGSIAIGVAVQAWRSWSDQRRIEKHLGRR
jgi:nitrogen fixation protein FixH